MPGERRMRMTRGVFLLWKNLRRRSRKKSKNPNTIPVYQYWYWYQVK
jgi:hypothetical protein